MKILVVAATAFEVRPLTNMLPLISQESDFLSTHLHQTATVDVLITGVGMMVTSWHLGKLLATKKYDLAINAGIAGAYDHDIKIGSVFHVTEDCILELGAEDGEGFLTIFELGLMDPDQYPYKGGRLVNLPQFPSNALNKLEKVAGTTVNTIHEQTSALHIRGKANFRLESMEGAAFLYGCMSERLPCIQIRSVSNYVEVRDKSRWNVKLALDNLNKTLLQIINEISG